ncbi:MAG: isochorismatase [Elainella sp. Prado103]|nr:isochorismatase [Elainella sp. Prado103]
MSSTTLLPLPAHFAAAQVGQVWPVPYQTLAVEAIEWRKRYQIAPVGQDRPRIGLLAIDVQNTFCIPGYELFVAGRSGAGAVEDNIRLCQFIYRNLAQITEIILTMDTHTAVQIFHPVFWVNLAGEHPAAMTMITPEQVEQGMWRVNPAVAAQLGQPLELLQAYALHYVRQLDQANKYLLTIWPYHSMLGGIGHAIVPAVEAACFFHGQVRGTQTRLELKGNYTLTENYSVLQPEVLTDQNRQPIAPKNTPLLQRLLSFDAIVIAGQAKSHCVAWTIEDLLREIRSIDPQLAGKVYLLEDCASPVVVPGVVDFTDAADAAYQRFAEAGMHLIRAEDALGMKVN